MIVLLAIASGILGRMGGAKGYHTLFRDWGCSLVVVLATIVSGMWHSAPMHGIVVGSAMVFLLSWGAFSTYWDWLFGYDCMWFSGFMAGIAIAPVVYYHHELWWLPLARGLALGIVWQCLNVYLPKSGIWIWRRDVVEENVRYQTVAIL